MKNDLPESNAGKFSIEPIDESGHERDVSKKNEIPATYRLIEPEAAAASANAVTEPEWAPDAVAKRAPRRASWDEMLKAGMNFEMVVAESFSVTLSALAWYCYVTFWIVVVQVVGFALLFLSLIGQDRDGATLIVFTTLAIGFMLVLFGIGRVSSKFFRCWFAICRESAQGNLGVEPEEEGCGLWYWLRARLAILVIQCLPGLVFLTVLSLANETHFTFDSDWANTVSVTTAAFGIACLLWLVVYHPIAMVVVTVEDTLNPFRVLRWMWNCRGGYALTLGIDAITNVAILAAATTFLTATLFGSMLVFERNWPEVVDRGREAFESLSSPPSESNSRYAPSPQSRLRKASRWNVEVPFGAYLFVFIASWTITLGSGYFLCHCCFARARILGLFANRYEARMEWKQLL